MLLLSLHKILFFFLAHPGCKADQWQCDKYEWHSVSCIVKNGGNYELNFAFALIPVWISTLW